ncbi:MAG: hypothetical protein U0Y82_12305 [Thermoleophilia bacterium]
MSPDPELLRAEFLGMAVRHDDLPRDRDTPALLLARSGEAYELNRLEFTDDMATLTGANGAELTMRPGQTTASSSTPLGFHEGLGRALGLLAEGLAPHEPERLWIEDLTLIAAWDTEEPDGARRYLTRDVLALDAERLQLLGSEDEDASHGLRVWRRFGDGSLDVAIEPMHSDPSRFYLRLAYAQDEPVGDLAAVGDRAEALNAYLHGRLAEFILARAPR